MIDTKSTSLIYETVNNGVYAAGFATTQEAYATRRSNPCSPPSTARATALPISLTWWAAASPKLLAPRSTTYGERFVRSMWGHFKCNLRRIVD